MENSFQQYISFIQKDILKNKRGNDHYWSHYINVEHSCYQPSDYVIQEIEIEGVGTNVYTSPIQIYTRYYIPQRQVTTTRRKHCKTIQTAMDYIFHFSSRFKLCSECLSLYKQNTCDKCDFFKGFYLTHKKEIINCGICKEPTYRTRLPCGHLFHQTCLLRLEKQDIKCPLCRSPIPLSFQRFLCGQENSEEEYNSSENDF